MNKTYKVWTRCGNCDHSQAVMIDSGITIEEHNKKGTFTKFICESCKCKTLNYWGTTPHCRIIMA